MVEIYFNNNCSYLYVLLGKMLCLGKNCCLHTERHIVRQIDRHTLELAYLPFLLLSCSCYSEKAKVYITVRFTLAFMN